MLVFQTVEEHAVYVSLKQQSCNVVDPTRYITQQYHCSHVPQQPNGTALTRQVLNKLQSGKDFV